MLVFNPWFDFEIDPKIYFTVKPGLKYAINPRSDFTRFYPRFEL